MKTDDLIKALTADNATVARPISQTLLLAVALGAIAAIAHFFSVLAMRSDFSYAITHEPRFVLKFVFTLGIAIPALLLMLRLARPDGKPGVAVWLLALPIALLVAGIGYEMMSVPAESWPALAMGTMPAACMKYIPLLATAPTIATLYALRNGAPSHPAAVGAAAGLFSGAIGAALYATFCVDDSPMFLAIWYVAGIALVTTVGALIGSRLLRW